MMTSNVPRVAAPFVRPQEGYAWIWLPGTVEPVVAGRLSVRGDVMLFTYGRSYLERPGAISLYTPELPLVTGEQPPLPGLNMAGCLRDAAPDYWGRRVIAYRQAGGQSGVGDVDEFDELTYLLESGSDRIGALDFQQSATEYIPRMDGDASFEELMEAADRIQDGRPLSPALDRALIHGTSIGGARPKVTLTRGQHKLIAKFSSSTDLFDVVKGEYVAMRLAAYAGVRVASVDLVTVGGRSVLLVERFDRISTDDGWMRVPMVSALTMLGLHEMMARYASYADLCTMIRHHFTDPQETLVELFRRLVFNILIGNTDDHARNHAAFWDGHQLSLTPAYDICPQLRTGDEASQAMLITPTERISRLAICRKAAPQFLIDANQANDIIKQQVAVITQHWPQICDEAQLSRVEQTRMWRRQILNPSIFYPA